MHYTVTAKTETFIFGTDGEKKKPEEEDGTRKCLEQYQIDRISNNFKAVEMCERLTWYGIHEWQRIEKREKEQYVVEVKLLDEESMRLPLY